MTRKRRRLVAVLAGLVMFGIATALSLLALNANNSLEFFAGPSEIKAESIPPDRQLRVGGLVERQSVRRDGTTVEFRITDGKNAVDVTYTGIVPDLFREGQGVVVVGKLGQDGIVHASTLLAKHDEKYMPREVVEALKKSGRWQEGAALPSAPEKTP